MCVFLPWEGVNWTSFKVRFMRLTCSIKKLSFFNLTSDLQQLVLSSILVHLWLQCVLSFTNITSQCRTWDWSVKARTLGTIYDGRPVPPFLFKNSFDKICSDICLWHYFLFLCFSWDIFLASSSLLWYTFLISFKDP